MPPLNENEGWGDYVYRIGMLDSRSLYTSSVVAETIEHVQRQYRAYHPDTQNIVETPPIEMFSRWQLPPLNIEGALYPNGAVEKSSPIEVSSLRLATEKIHKENGQQRNVIRSLRSQMGKKEKEFHSILMDKKFSQITASEALASEIPVCLGDVSDKWHELAKISPYISLKSDWTFGCSLCSKVTTDSGCMFLCGGNIFCAEHVPNFQMCITCRQLVPNCKEIKNFEGKNIMVCESCIENRRTCRICSEKITPAYIEQRQCGTCVNRAYDNETPYRHFSWGLRWVSKNTGKTYKSNRMFSCEIEALSPNSNWAAILHKSLPKEMGMGQDGSVGVRGHSPYGFEVQTPRLQGTKGEELIERTVKGLAQVEPHIDETCGMHIHLDGKGIIRNNRREYPAELVQLLKSYLVFEDVFLSFLPFSRRRNDYCRRLAGSISLVELETVETIFDVEKLWYKERHSSDIRSAKGHHYHSSRYFGANLHPLLTEGHFEVRFHSGTMNAKKILEWANLHALVLDACSRLDVTDSFLRNYEMHSRLSEKTTLLFDLIGLSEKSREYFRSRQKKFGNAKHNDEEIKEKSKRNLIFDEFQPLGFSQTYRGLQSRPLIVEEFPQSEIEELTDSNS